MMIVVGRNKRETVPFATGVALGLGLVRSECPELVGERNPRGTRYVDQLTRRLDALSPDEDLAGKPVESLLSELSYPQLRELGAEGHLSEWQIEACLAGMNGRLHQPFESA